MKSVIKFFTNVVIVAGSFFLLAAGFIYFRILSSHSISIGMFLACIFAAMVVLTLLHSMAQSTFFRRLLAVVYTTKFSILAFFILVGSYNHGVRNACGIVFSSFREPLTHLAHYRNSPSQQHSKFKLFVTNLKLTALQLINRDEYVESTTNFFDYSVSAFHYGTLRFLFDEIFVAGPYAFKTSNKKPFIVDCGSNIGISVLYFKTLYPDATIIAFEPDPRTFGLLKKNIEQNNLSNTKAFNAAISDSEKPLTFFFNTHTPGHPCMSSDLGRSHIVREKQTVQAAVLSKFITQPVDFLKMDIEGAEYGALHELAQTGKLSLVQQMVIEYHHHLTNNNDQLAAFLHILESNGFGYQICTQHQLPSEKNIFQDMLIYAYQK